MLMARSIVNNGNSDPFKTAAVILDSRALQALNFNGECFTLWITSMYNNIDKDSASKTKVLQNTVDALQDDAMASSRLACLPSFESKR